MMYWALFVLFFDFSVIIKMDNYYRIYPALFMADRKFSTVIFSREKGYTLDEINIPSYYISRSPLPVSSGRVITVE